MGKLLTTLYRKVLPYIPYITAVAFLGFFSYTNYSTWGDWGEFVHLLGLPVPAYTLIWLWIAMIAMIIGVNIATPRGQQHSLWFIISAWWAANIGVTSVLNSYGRRAIEESTALIGSYPDIMVDFIAQGALDFTALLVIYLAVRWGYIGASALLVVFGGFLVANLFGHAFGAYGLVAGTSLDAIAASYDAYMYLVFTALLLIQVGGAVLDLLIRISGAGYDVYADVRPYFNDVIHRRLHL